MCTKEQVQKDVEFGRMLARGPASPLIHVSTVTLSNDDRYKWFNQTLMTYGISALEQALKIGEGLAIRAQWVNHSKSLAEKRAKSKVHDQGNVRRLKLVVK